MTDSSAISVVIPAYNERARLADTVVAVVEYLREAREPFEVIISDDGSSDGTDELSLELGADFSEVRLLRTDTNRGKGHAVKVGMGAADARQVLFCDADGATPIGELARLRVALEEGADIAVGSRAMPGDGVERETKRHRRMMGRAFSRFVTQRLAPDIRDTQCGFKLFTGPAADVVAEHLTVDGFGFDIEIFVIARNLGLAVSEVPVSWHDTPGSKVRLVRDSMAMVRDASRVSRRAGAGFYRL